MIKINCVDSGQIAVIAGHNTKNQIEILMIKIYMRIVFKLINFCIWNIAKKTFLIHWTCWKALSNVSKTEIEAMQNARKCQNWQQNANKSWKNQFQTCICFEFNNQSVKKSNLQKHFQITMSNNSESDETNQKQSAKNELFLNKTFGELVKITIC